MVEIEFAGCRGSMGVPLGEFVGVVVRNSQVC